MKRQRDAGSQYPIRLRGPMVFPDYLPFKSVFVWAGAKHVSAASSSDKSLLRAFASNKQLRRRDGVAGQDPTGDEFCRPKLGILANQRPRLRSTAAGGRTLCCLIGYRRQPPTAARASWYGLIASATTDPAVAIRWQRFALADTGQCAAREDSRAAPSQVCLPVWPHAATGITGCRRADRSCGRYPRLPAVVWRRKALLP